MGGTCFDCFTDLCKRPPLTRASAVGGNDLDEANGRLDRVLSKHAVKEQVGRLLIGFVRRRLISRDRNCKASAVTIRFRKELNGSGIELQPTY